MTIINPKNPTEMTTSTPETNLCLQMPTSTHTNTKNTKAPIPGLTNSMNLAATDLTAPILPTRSSHSVPLRIQLNSITMTLIPYLRLLLLLLLLRPTLKLRPNPPCLNVKTMYPIRLLSSTSVMALPVHLQSSVIVVPVSLGVIKVFFLKAVTPKQLPLSLVILLPEHSAATNK